MLEAGRRLEARGLLASATHAIEIDVDDLLTLRHVVRLGSSSLSLVVTQDSRSDQTRLVSPRDGFDEFVATHERHLRQALTAAFGIDGGRDAAADALAYAWEHWARVASMTNPAGYLFVVGRDRHRRSGATGARRRCSMSGPSGPNPGASPPS